eukprot:CAMPEP_0180253950 /NCGR_PEP_ID=MMETSP0987-20121128/39893_1 /TAXON_ID=697907 /ORGANISM="non described non described, Strain CCMP2293" /LENGTH=80 /DNA_ID=CAMNT_0022222891 /DNA_START=189 /DNA_END=428 /DNA_ORIENTATION=-
MKLFHVYGSTRTYRAITAVAKSFRTTASPFPSFVFPGNVEPWFATVLGAPGPSTGNQVRLSLDTETVYDVTHCSAVDTHS